MAAIFDNIPLETERYGRSLLSSQYGGQQYRTEWGLREFVYHCVCAGIS